MRAPPSARVIRSVGPNYSGGHGVPSHEEVNQRLQEISRETPAPYGYSNRGGYSRENTNIAPPPMNMDLPIAQPTPMPPPNPIAPHTPINMGHAPQLECNMPYRLETPQASLRLTVMPQNPAAQQHQQNQGGMAYGQNGAPAQLTYTGYTVGPNGVPQKITTMETTTVSHVEATPTQEAPPPVEVNESRCCFPRDSDELHYSYSNASDSIAGRMFRVLLLAVPICMIIIGYCFKEECPIRDWIPIWLISSGSLWIVHTVLYFLFRNNPGKNTSACRSIETVCFYMATVWFVVGSTWTFGSMQDVSFYNVTCDHNNWTISTTDATNNLLRGTDSVDSNWTTTLPTVTSELPRSSTQVPFNNNCYCHPVPFIAASVIICLAYVFIAVLIFFVVFTFEYSYNMNPPAQANPLPPPVISQRTPLNARP